MNGVRSLIGEYAHPYVYLDEAVIEQAGLDGVEESEAVAILLRECPGICAAITARVTRYAADRNRLVECRELHNFNAKRSGDLYVVLDSNAYVSEFDGPTVASNHCPPRNYDTFVPIFFVGSGFEAKSVSRSVTPYDIAPTLSARAGIKPPAGNLGNNLQEVLA